MNALTMQAQQQKMVRAINDLSKKMEHLTDVHNELMDHTGIIKKRLKGIEDKIRVRDQRIIELEDQIEIILTGKK